MIEKLSIKNFQALEQLQVSLGKLTTFTGPSDTGKSSVVRALLWLAANRPRGDQHVRQGVCSAAVLAEGCKVARRRGKSVNEYRLGDETFKAMGTDVPEQVEQLLRIDPSLNFQQQHDVPFWVGLSSSEVARQLNRVVDLGAVDDVMKELSLRLRRAGSLEQSLTDQLEQTSKNLERYEGVDRLHEMLQEHEQAAAEHEQAAADAADLAHALLAYDRAEAQLQLCEPVIANGKRAAMAVKKAATASEEAQQLQQLAGRIKQLQAAAAASLPAVEPVDELVEQAAHAADVASMLRGLLSKIEEAAGNVARHREAADAARQWLDENEPAACPTCGRPL